VGHKRRVQLVGYAAGLDPARAPGWVDLEHAAEVPRTTEDHARPDRLTGLRRPTSPGRDRYPEPAADFDRGHDIGRARREGNQERHDLVAAGIRGIERPAETILTYVMRAHGPGHCLMPRSYVTGP